ncbi:hypothetical protein HDU92_005149 [Lobulomyces angularis]|nr:hypothetical protein HDU92_005149 [Lobulomyces angularis]
MNFRLLALLLFTNLTYAYDSYGISERPNIIAKDFRGSGISLADFQNFNNYISDLPTQPPTAQQVARFNNAGDFANRRIAIEEYANSLVNGETRIPGGPIVEGRICTIASDAERSVTGTAKYTSLLESVGHKLYSTGAFYEKANLEFAEGYMESTKAAGRGRQAAFIEKNRAKIDAVKAANAFSEGKAIKTVLNMEAGPPIYESHAKNIMAHSQNVNSVKAYHKLFAEKAAIILSYIYDESFQLLDQLSSNLLRERFKILGETFESFQLLHWNHTPNLDSKCCYEIMNSLERWNFDRNFTNYFNENCNKEIRLKYKVVDFEGKFGYVPFDLSDAGKVSLVTFLIVERSTDFEIYFHDLQIINLFDYVNGYFDTLELALENFLKLYQYKDYELQKKENMEKSIDPYWKSYDLVSNKVEGSAIINVELLND